MQNIDRSSYYYNFSGFTDICHVIEKNREKLGCEAFLILCALINRKETSEERERLLKEIIISGLDSGDAFTKYDDFRYLVLKIGNMEEVNRFCDYAEQAFRERSSEGERIVCSSSVLKR